MVKPNVDTTNASDVPSSVVMAAGSAADADIVRDAELCSASSYTVR